MAGAAEQAYGVVEGQVRGPRQPVEPVEQAAGVLHDLQRFGQLAEGFDCRVADSWGPPVRRVGAGL
ncbi:hypothetical protein GCM10010977_04390 [Citricoccus zhacaiensis]|uniref:Uncharacterized protein n=1 Tax=Citricoccus zhacaiensis TaxID=489142 RepID=A0ABQ2LP24_9MICC|nr:hypothetical protein GCM10010977_04390 [Citricoccus zhacaiensis]